MKYTKNLNSFNLLLLSICLIAFTMTLIGCGGSLNESKAERARRWKMITRSNLSMVADDVDAVLLMDRRSRLSKRLIRE